MIVLIIWLLSVVALSLLTFTAAFICLFLKGTAQTRCIDVILCLTTLTILASLAQYVLPSDTSNAGKTTIDPGYIRQADLIGRTLQLTSYIGELNPGVQLLAKAEGFATTKDALAKAETEISKFVQKLPDNDQLVARLAIIRHEEGGNTDEIFSQYRKNTKRPDALPLALETVYAANKTEADTEQLRSARTIIKAEIPDGWYQQEALKAACPQSNAVMKTEQSTRHKQDFESWNAKYTSYLVVRFSFALAGIAVVMLWLKNRQTNQIPALASSSFRKVYGCILSSLYAQMTMSFMCGFTLGVMQGIQSAISHSTSKIDPSAPGYGLLISLPTLFAGIVAANLAAYWFICRPAGISLWAGFWKNGAGANKVPLLKAAVAGFFATVFLNIVARWLTYLIANPNESSTNPIQLAMIDAIASNDASLVITSILVICAFAPVGEELLCRGLLYPWLRNRWGVAVGVIVSAVTFAAWHFDPVNFPQHFAGGVVLALLYERTRSLPTVVATHALWNVYAMTSAAWLIRL